MTHRITDLIIVPASLWQRPETIDALRSRDMRRLFHLLRKYAGASQTRIGIACGLAQPKISAIMNGTHQVESSTCSSGSPTDWTCPARPGSPWVSPHQPWT